MSKNNRMKNTSNSKGLNGKDNGKVAIKVTEQSKTVKILTFISAIYLTSIMLLLILFKFKYTGDFAIKLMAPIVMILAWVCRYNMIKGKALWTVYGFVLSIGSIDVVGMIGYWKAVKAIKAAEQASK